MEIPGFTVNCKKLILEIKKLSESNTLSKLPNILSKLPESSKILNKITIFSNLSKNKDVIAKLIEKKLITPVLFKKTNIIKNTVTNELLIIKEEDLIRITNETEALLISITKGIFEELIIDSKDYLKNCKLIPEDKSFIEINFKMDYLRTQIINRYSFIPRNKSNLSGIIIDSFIPQLLLKANFEIEKLKELCKKELPKTCYTMSELISKMTNIKKIDIEDMVTGLDYSFTSFNKNIKRILNKVKSKNLDIVFIGAGGTCANTIYWLSKLCEKAGVYNLFESTSIYDEDHIDFSNILRFPLDIFKPEEKGNINYYKKVSIVKDYIETLSKKSPILEYKNLTEIKYSDLKYKEKKSNRKNSLLFYGAPGLEDREIFSKQGSFISGTHSGNNCYLHLNPSQNLDIQVENYGLIQLNCFFMNQLKMAIELVKFLGTDNINLNEKDKKILDYSFKTKKSTKGRKTINWEIQSNNIMGE